MIVWGGNDGNVNVNTGGRYNPSTDTWVTVNTTGAPTARVGHTAVWTGSKMIMWGASNDATGGRYNPSTDSWVATSTSGAPTARSNHTAIWTGSEMIVWGGYAANTYFNTGGRYNPSTDTWVTVNTIGAPSARLWHTAVWTGTEMVVWGGYDGSNPPVYLNTGGRYNPTTDSWVATSISGVPTARSNHTAIWTGTEMIVWGGGYNTGGKYDPSTDSWTATSTIGAPSARSAQTTVWTGTEMVVWGGSDNNALNTGGRYNPITDIWFATDATGAPIDRFGHTSAWTGSEMIVWGGNDNNLNRLNTGGKYCAQPPVHIAGSVSYCSNPSPSSVQGVTLTVTGDETTSTITDSSGAYTLSLAYGRSYDVTPSKTARSPGSPGINTIDVVATQRHFLGIALLTGCRLTAADVNGDSAVDTIDVIAVQRFYLSLTSGIANVGKYKFGPAIRSYSNVVSDQSGQNYDTLVFGDVAAGFVEP